MRAHALAFTVEILLTGHQWEPVFVQHTVVKVSYLRDAL